MKADLNWRGVTGDVGGTNARFAVAELADGRCSLNEIRTYPCADFADFRSLVAQYLADAGIKAAPAAVLAAAGPVEANRVEFTNNNFVVDGDELIAAGLFSRCRVVNDFAALAASLPLLGEKERPFVGPALQGSGPTRLVVGPGTGLGAAFLTEIDGRHRVLPGEGGHAAFAPTDETEIEILRFFQRKLGGRVSVERLLSGSGIEMLYDAMLAIEGRAAAPLHNTEITRHALAGEAIARATLLRFCAMLGSFAGDLALIGGAWAGVYIGGGIVGHFRELFLASNFRERFEAKGRFASLMSEVPVHLITAPYPALVGGASVGAAEA